MAILDDATEMARSDRTFVRAVGVIMGATGSHDRATAEAILMGLARRLDQPVQAVAADLVSGYDFAGRPSWL